MNTQYLIRLDDACPWMNRGKWQIMEEILDEEELCPLVGVIPFNEDKDTMPDDADPDFWIKTRKWQSKGWSIALHGYHHCYTTVEAGINPLWKRSEYAGVPIDEQRHMIREGYKKLIEEGLRPLYFFAPSHTFDENTIIALKKETPIRIISDTYSLRPYTKDGFTFIPCQMGRLLKMKIPGLFTICLHPNSMNEHQFKEVDKFIKGNRQKFISYSNVDVNNLSEIRLIDKFVQWCYFKYKRMR